MGNSAARNLLLLIAVVAAGFIIYAVLTMPDHRTLGQKISDATNAPSIDQAGRELEDRTPGQKLGDAIKDNTSAH